MAEICEKNKRLSVFPLTGVLFFVVIQLALLPLRITFKFDESVVIGFFLGFRNFF